jgi:hypothetical protein
MYGSLGWGWNGGGGATSGVERECELVCVDEDI